MTGVAPSPAMIRALTRAAFVAIFAAVPGLAGAETCAGNPGALGTARVLELDVRSTPRIGRKQFPATLPLQRKELVLTFNDGPWPATTPKVLDALKLECVRATFFLRGQHSESSPALARRILAEGHTIGHLTYSHATLSRMPRPAAEAEINRGIEEDEYAVFGLRRSDPAVPFFRFPGFAATPALLQRLNARGFVVFGTDIWGQDWQPMQPERQLQILMRQIETAGRGIVMLHDTKEQTAAMMPAFLRELRRRGYRIVHVVQAGSRGALR